MAGHSKWANIKNRKGAQDAKRGKVFSQISKMIRMAVREGKSGDPKFNPGLRLALDKARAANMPKQNIQKAIDRGLGKSSSGAVIQEIVYEGFGPNGVGVLAVALTDNTQRTSSDVKHLFSRAGGSMGGPNTVMYMFQHSDDGGYQSTMPLDVDEQTLEKVLDLMDALREHEDIEDVYVALDIPEDDE